VFTTQRGTLPDDVALLNAVRVALGNDPTLGLSYSAADPTHFVVTKTTDWLAAELIAVQDAIDGAAASTPQLAAQRAVDAYGPLEMATLRVMLDEFNNMRNELNTILAAMSPPLTPALPLRTENQLRNALRNKAGQ
jgi:hypothetical protein